MTGDLGSATQVGTHRAELGECPVWNGETGQIHWIDGPGAQVLTTDPESGVTTAIPLPNRPGSIVPLEGGGLACAAGRRVFRLTPDGEGGDIAVLPTGTPRFNDAKCDALGRLWVGTALPEKQPVCALYRIDDNGPTVMLDGVRMSNGLGWSLDNSAMYHVDTGAGTLTVFGYDLASGSLGEGRVLHRFAAPHLPDGLSVDTEGFLWLAIWGGACVLRMTPDGDIAGRVHVPAGFATSCAFGGSQNETLFITTAAGGKEPGDRGGGLFKVHTGVAGGPIHCFGGLVGNTDDLNKGPQPEPCPIVPPAC